MGYTKIGKITIGNNVFIGANTTVLPNIVIGDNVVIGCNSVITKNIKNNSVVVGNPARVICTYDEYIHKNEINKKKTAVYDKSYIIGNITKEKKEQMKNDLKGKIGYII